MEMGMKMDKGRQQRKRHILGGALSEVEVETLQEMASHHRHADFRRRALGVLALNDGRSGPDICGVLRVSVPQLYNWARAWRERGLSFKRNRLSLKKSETKSTLTPCKRA